MAKKKKDKAIVLDYDDTVVNFLDKLCELHNSLHGTSLSACDIKSWSFVNLDLTDARGKTVKGADLESTFRRFEHGGLYATLPLIPHSKYVIDIIQKMGYKVIVLTARKECFRLQTELNLIINNIKPDDLIFNWDKAKVINELKERYEIVAFADDRLSTVQAVEEHCSVEFNCVVTKEYNRHEEVTGEIIRINDLVDLLKLLK